jgi:DNA invertase Pin-like site-specific DNA recombinase
LTVAVGRPGDGGRLPRATPYTGTTATAELIAEFGQPVFDSFDGVQMLIWELNEEGSGIILGRLSGQELQGGETAMGQIHPLRRLAHRLGLLPRLVVVSVHNTGARAYDQRPDFGLIDEAIESGWCDWIAWQRPDRIAREILPAEQHYNRLRGNDVALYLDSLGRRIDWRNDMLYLRTLGIVSAEERQAIYDRTRGALVSRYIAEGRGWPASKRFGFRRNFATKFLEVDPEQWEFVKRIHLRYSEIGHQRSGLRQLSAELRDLGCDLSHVQIREILRSRIYVDGTLEVNVDGQRVPQKPISLADPIPEDLYQRNQELLALRAGREKRTRPGDFCLNGVPIRHARCENQRNDAGGRSLLKGRLLFGRVAAYRHSPWVPKQCHGYVIEQSALESAVLGALPQLAAEPTLRRVWEERQEVAKRGFLVRLLDEEQTMRLRRRVQLRKRQKAQLSRAYIARGDQGHPLDPHEHGELVAALELEITQLNRRLAEPCGRVGRSEARGVSARTLAKAIVKVGADTRTTRAALVQAAVSGIRLVDREDGAVVVVEVETPLLRSGG